MCIWGIYSLISIPFNSSESATHFMNSSSRQYNLLWFIISVPLKWDTNEELYFNFHPTFAIFLQK